MQHLPVIFCMDRAGLVGEDGQTHMGLYDIAYMLAVPGMTVTAPKDGDELIGLLRTALATPGRAVLHPLSARQGAGRAPPGQPTMPAGALRHLGAAARRARTWPSSRSAPWCSPRCGAAELLAGEGIDCAVVNCRFLKPMDHGMLEALRRASTGPWSRWRRGPS